MVIELFSCIFGSYDISKINPIFVLSPRQTKKPVFHFENRLFYVHVCHLVLKP